MSTPHPPTPSPSRGEGEKSIRRNPVILTFAALLALAYPTAAQNTAIEPLIPYEGTLSTPGEVQSWTFSGFEGGVYSLLVTSTGDLDPVVELRNSGGQVLTVNDDFAYPGRRDALLQAVTLPRIDTYTVAVHGFGETVGDYTLTLFPGYAEIAEQDDFTAAGAWRVSAPATIEGVDERVVVTLSGVRASARAERRSAIEGSDFYASVRVNIQRGTNGWRAGLSLRGDEDGYYALRMNDSGAWRMDYIDSEGVARQLRDWTVHPAIRTGAETFTLGVLANGPAFDVFYDGAWVGQAVETESGVPDSGQIGLYTGTPDAIGSGVVVAFDDLLVTQPVRLGDTEIMPGVLVPGGQALTVQELERRRVIPAGGRLSLTVPESSGRQVEPGVNRVLLGRGATFGDYVLYTTFTLGTATPDALVGCGLLFGNLSDTRHAVAFLDRQGGYGISARDGENYAPGLFGENEAFVSTARHSLIVVKRGLRADLFVDRQHVGGIDLPDVFDAPGQVGNAVVNYQRSDTTCQFADTWVWNLSP